MTNSAPRATARPPRPISPHDAAQAARNWLRRSGPQAAYNLLLRAEVVAGWRKPSLALYDHTLHLIGGGEKYGCTMAQALQDDFDITLITHRPVTTADLMKWYDLDLSRCRMKVMPLEFFAARSQGRINPDRVSARTQNPFLAVSRESGNYDFFVNNSMLEMVYPLANMSLFVCHFPERPKGPYFYVQHYRHLIYNSRYTKSWIEKKWGIAPPPHLPAGGHGAGRRGEPPKENVILSVARFESGGSKQQAEMIDAFPRLRAEEPRAMRDWKLVLCGGSAAANPYLERLRDALAARPGLPVGLRVNISLAELKRGTPAPPSSGISAAWARATRPTWSISACPRSRPCRTAACRSSSTAAASARSWRTAYPASAFPAPRNCWSGRAGPCRPGAALAPRRGGETPRGRISAARSSPKRCAACFWGWPKPTRRESRCEPGSGAGHVSAPPPYPSSS